MLNTTTRSAIIGGTWLTAIGLILILSVAMDARLSTTALLLAFGALPVVVVVLLRGGAPSASVTEILRSTDATDVRY
jgi:hypothetical protein